MRLSIVKVLTTKMLSSSKYLHCNTSRWCKNVKVIQIDLCAEELHNSVPAAVALQEAELQRRFFEDFGGGLCKGSIIEREGCKYRNHDFCSYFRSKQQANLHGIV